jgi:hypothetical protein
MTVKTGKNESGKLTQEQVNEIVGTLETGLKCFWSKSTNQLVFVPDIDEFPDGAEFFEDEFEKLDNNNEDFIEIEAMPSYEVFKVMQNFTQQLDDYQLKFKLENILSGKKPFHHFKIAIDNSGDYRELWFEFRSKKHGEWIIIQTDQF